jgi:hypothetical protein
MRSILVFQENMCMMSSCFLVVVFHLSPTPTPRLGNPMRKRAAVLLGSVFVGSIVISPNLLKVKKNKKDLPNL